MRNGRRLVSVVLNSSGIAGETIALLDAGFATAQSRTIDVSRPGFAGVRNPGSSSTGRDTVLAGWELPFLRAFTTGTRTTISFAGRRLIEW